MRRHFEAMVFFYLAEELRTGRRGDRLGGVRRLVQADQKLRQVVGNFPEPLVNQRRQQRGRRIGRAAAQVGRRFDRAARPPPSQDLRGGIREQARGQADPARRLKLADLGEHRFQAHVARHRLDQREDRLGVLRLVLGLFSPWVSSPQPARARTRPIAAASRRAGIAVNQFCSAARRAEAIIRPTRPSAGGSIRSSRILFSNSTRTRSGSRSVRAMLAASQSVSLSASATEHSRNPRWLRISPRCRSIVRPDHS